MPEETRSPADLVQTAAQEPAQAAPPAAAEPSAGAGGGLDVGELGNELVTLLANHPMLAEQVADVIGKYFEGGGRMEPMGGPVTGGEMGGQVAGGEVRGQPVAGGGAAVTAAAPVAAPAAGDALAPLGEFLRRLEALEEGHANIMLDREIDEARREYERLAQQLPVLPEFNEKEIMQIALENQGIPLSKAVRIWALDRAMEGEESLVDRLIARKMEASKGAKLPRPEGPGGSVAAGHEGPPQDRKEAMRRAREMARAFFGGVTG